jgi:hypothetical protein
MMVHRGFPHYNTFVNSVATRHFPRDSPLKSYGISSLLEDDDLQKFCVVVRSIDRSAAPPDILTDHLYVEGHARAHIVQSVSERHDCAKFVALHSIPGSTPKFAVYHQHFEKSLGSGTGSYMGYRRGPGRFR